MITLPEMFWNKATAGSPRVAMARHQNDSLTIREFKVSPSVMFETVMQHLMTDLTAAEIVFGVARRAHVGNIMTVHHWRGEHDENNGFVFGFVACDEKFCPIDAINWEPSYWSALAQAEFDFKNQEMLEAMDKEMKARGLKSEDMYELVRRERETLIADNKKGED